MPSGNRRMRRLVAMTALPTLTLALTSCDYLRLLRPSVLKQLNPRVVRLVNELPATDEVNEALIGRLFAHGGAGDARVGDDGVMRIAVNVPRDKYLWEPAVIIMPRGGELEIRFTNPDRVPHAAFLPSNGGRQMLDIPEGQAGRARLRLDQPGYYFFGCPIMNHAGRGMLGLILVKGGTPDEAKLDRPPQRRP